MKYAVVYQSESGNTRAVAETIYQSIISEDKVICDIDTDSTPPEADVYFIGFGIHNNNCSIDMVNYMEEIQDAKYALFMTCGYTPSEKYKQKLMKNLDIWLPEDSKLLGTYLCQGKVHDLQKSVMVNKMPERSQELQYMFEQGESHPDRQDLQDAAAFVSEIQVRAEN